MISFKLAEKKKQFYLSTGFYHIYLSGGFFLENIDLIDVGLKDLRANNYITLKEFYIKRRSYVNGQRAVACYEFEVVDSTELELEFGNIEQLEMKYSMLFLANLLFPKKIEVEQISVVIQ